MLRFIPLFPRSAESVALDKPFCKLHVCKSLQLLQFSFSFAIIPQRRAKVKKERSRINMGLQFTDSRFFTKKLPKEVLSDQRRRNFIRFETPFNRSCLKRLNFKESEVLSHYLFNFKELFF